MVDSAPYKISTHIYLVKHNSYSRSTRSSWHVVSEFHSYVSGLSMGTHNFTPDNSAPGSFAVDDFGVFLSFVNVRNSFSKIPLAVLFIVNSFEFDNSLILVLLF